MADEIQNPEEVNRLKEPREPYVYTPKTDVEINAVAKGIHQGHIFTDRHVRSDDEIPMVFMVLTFMGEEDMEELRKAEISLIYEYMDKASPRGVNGMPSFFSMNFMNKTDTEKCFNVINKLREAEAAILAITDTPKVETAADVAPSTETT